MSNSKKIMVLNIYISNISDFNSLRTAPPLMQTMPGGPNRLPGHQCFRLLSLAATHQKIYDVGFFANQDRYCIITSMEESNRRSLSILASFFAVEKHSLAFVLSEYSNVVPKR